MRRFVFASLIPVLFVATARCELPVAPGAEYYAWDSLNHRCDTSADAQSCIDGLSWPPAEFAIRCTPATSSNGDVLVRFPTPVPSGNKTNDLVTLEWYVARDGDSVPIAAPAVVVVHESGGNMAVGRIFARGLRGQGVHAFMLQLPYYGERLEAGTRREAKNLVTATRQAIADVRRARDAVAALPLVDARTIALQGTSLGGFVAATAAGLDRGYDQVFLMLAGGDLFSVIQNGKKDAARYRDALAEVGLSGETLKTKLLSVEPVRLAHRLNPASTWLYSATRDEVVPFENAALLAQAAKLDSAHHVRMFANHYSGIIYLPFLVQHIGTQIHNAGQGMGTARGNDQTSGD